MIARPCIAVCAAIFGIALLAVPVMAGQITERQKRDCRGDYQRYCNAYGLGTEGLRACMSRSFKKLTNSCVAALVDAGEVSQKQANSVRKKTSSAKHATHKRTTTSHKHTTKKRH